MKRETGKEKGNVSVNTENIFPIIRKWLYSDRDIFLRELVSNSSDAIAKLKKLLDMGEAAIPADEALSIRVVLDKAKKKLMVEDNGLGMTNAEIKKYINQIAFSGAMDFVEKYKEKATNATGIIGHFGLGFYSAFMVAEKVRIDSLSYTEGSEAASWESEDGMAYEMGPSDKQTRGTLITIDLTQEADEFLTAAKCREILRKYCAFMPYPIYFMDVQEEEDNKKRKEEEKKKKKDKNTDTDIQSAQDSAEGEESEEIEPINDTHPLWLKNPKECTDEEYRDFYRKAFFDFREPLFWIHLNMDYPFNLKGILYFPKTDNTYETLEGRIKLYYNQVFVADNIKEVIPEFLFLLKGCIDCPDLPLNVSRSFLQNDGYVKKLSAHIIKKVADKLTSLYENSPEEYGKYWSDIGVFVKYGCMREDKFYDKVKDILVAKTVDQEIKSFKELGERIYYTNDMNRQIAYIHLAKEKGRTVIVMDHELDNNFMSFLEYKNGKVKFLRVDAQIEGQDGPSERRESVEKLFKAATGNSDLKVEIKSLGEKALAAVLTETEESRRMQEMQKMYLRQMGSNGDADVSAMFPVSQILVVNADSPLIGKLTAMNEIPGKEEKTSLLALHVFDLARLSHGSLDPEAMARFLSRSTELLSELTND